MEELARLVERGWRAGGGDKLSTLGSFSSRSRQPVEVHEPGALDQASRAAVAAAAVPSHQMLREETRCTPQRGARLDGARR